MLNLEKLESYYDMKVSYQIGEQDFRWFKIIRGLNSKETSEYNKLSFVFENSNDGTIFWSCQPLSLYSDMCDERCLIDKSKRPFI